MHAYTDVQTAARGYANEKYFKLYFSLLLWWNREQELIISAVKKLGVFRIEDKVSKDTTHVVYGEARRTLNVLHAMARGCWLISKEWVSENSLFFVPTCWSFSSLLFLLILGIYKLIKFTLPFSFCFVFLFIQPLCLIDMQPLRLA